MRILPITLSLLMIFTPAYSAYASMLPAKGQIVQIGKKGGALIKTGAGKAVKGGLIGVGIEGGRAVWAWCKNNQKKCKDKIGDAYEIICDVTSCDVERKDDSDGMCYTAGRGKYSSPHEACRRSYQDISDITFIEDTSDEYTRNNPNHVGYCEGTYPGLTFKSNISTVAKISCDDDQNKRLLTEDELKTLAKKIAQKMDDDDIKNYYNTKYDDIIINNNYYYGDEINKQTNIDKYCESNACNEISKEIEKDIKQKKYDIDDVNKKNCTIEESTGKYIACNMTIKNEDENNTTNKGDTTNKDTNVTKKEDEDDKPPFCKTSDFFKEACEYFDWVDDEPSEKQDKKVNIEDEEEEKLNKDRIDIDEGCPPDQHISVSMPWGYSTTIEFTYKPYCDFARDLKPYMTATGAIVSMYIVGSCGRRL